MSAQETLKLVSQQWCNLQDLMRLAQVGRNSALTIKGTIKSNLEQQGIYVPKTVVPMHEVVKYLNIDINYLEERCDSMKGAKINA